MKYRLHILVPISVLAFLTLFSLYVDRKQLVAGILVCEKPLGERPFAFGLNEQFAGVVDRFERTLAESTVIDDLVASSVIMPTRRGDESSLEALSALSQNNPQNQLAAVQLLSVCTREAEHPACNDEVIERAIELEGNNGAMWSVVSSLRYVQADTYGAMLALEAAVEAPNYDDYFQRGLELVLDALPEVNDDLLHRMYGRAISHGVSLSINNYYSIHPVVEMCSANLIENQRLASACMSYGRRMEEQASSLVGSGMGVAIQISTYGGLGNDAEFQRREEEYLRSQQERSSSDTRLALGLLEHDGRLNRYYFDQVVLSGEQAAISSVAEEAKRLSGQWNYDPCPSVLFGNLFFKANDFSRWSILRMRSWIGDS